ncbi:MAG TPA: hypothetical protein VI685_13870 [Candidatus Angelobacter sp.]
MADENIDSALGIGPSQPPGGMIDPAVKAMVRYKDGYRLANFTATAGTVIKILAVVLSVAVVSAEFYLAQQILGNPQSDMAFAVFVLVSGVWTFGFFFILGVIVSALGQQLKAGLDSAVNSSPFLDIPAKARAMSLDQ